MRDARIIVIGLLYVIFMVAGCPAWLHMKTWWMPLVHHFFHANIFHLAVNCFSLWMLLRIKWPSSSLIAAFIFASLSWFCTKADPVGISNFLFAMVGISSPSIRHKWWRSSSAFIFFGVNILLIFFSQVSAVTHLVSFFLGSLYAGMSRIINRLKHDIGA